VIGEGSADRDRACQDRMASGPGEQHVVLLGGEHLGIVQVSKRRLRIGLEAAVLGNFLFELFA
jgi:hypothetical protein